MGIFSVKVKCGRVCEYPINWFTSQTFVVPSDFVRRQCIKQPHHKCTLCVFSCVYDRRENGEVAT